MDLCCGIWWWEYVVWWRVGGGEEMKVGVGYEYVKGSLWVHRGYVFRVWM